MNKETENYDEELIVGRLFADNQSGTTIVGERARDSQDVLWGDGAVVVGLGVDQIGGFNHLEITEAQSPVAGLVLREKKVVFEFIGNFLDFVGRDGFLLET